MVGWPNETYCCADQLIPSRCVSKTRDHQFYTISSRKAPPSLFSKKFQLRQLLLMGKLIGKMAQSFYFQVSMSKSQLSWTKELLPIAPIHQIAAPKTFYLMWRFHRGIPKSWYGCWTQYCVAALGCPSHRISIKSNILKKLFNRNFFISLRKQVLYIKF